MQWSGNGVDLYHFIWWGSTARESERTWSGISSVSPVTDASLWKQDTLQATAWAALRLYLGFKKNFLSPVATGFRFQTHREREHLCYLPLKQPPASGWRRSSTSTSVASRSVFVRMARGGRAEEEESGGRRSREEEEEEEEKHKKTVGRWRRKSREKRKDRKTDRQAQRTQRVRKRRTWSARDLQGEGS